MHICNYWQLPRFCSLSKKRACNLIRKHLLVLLNSLLPVALPLLCLSSHTDQAFPFPYYPRWEELIIMLESVPCNMILFSSTGCHPQTWSSHIWRRGLERSKAHFLAEFWDDWIAVHLNMDEIRGKSNYQVKILKRETGKQKIFSSVCITSWEIIVWRKLFIQ